MQYHRITITGIKRARVLYERNEPRNLFYKTATELIALSLAGRTSLSLAEVLAVLLQTWNREYYRFHKFDAQHFTDIDKLIVSQKKSLTIARKKNIGSFSSSDKVFVISIFKEFELVLGPVGAAKALHLFAPQYFPLWDREIAKNYVGHLGVRGFNSERYWQMQCYTAQQAAQLKSDGYNGNSLKAIDEYNYCHFSKKWL